MTAQGNHTIAEVNTIPVYGITGIIGAGKSAVCDLFRELGIPTLSADRLSREVTKKGSPALNHLVSLFNNRIIDESGELNRKALAEVIFSSSEERARVEKILHPAIRQAFLGELRNIRATSNAPFILYEAPLLLESAVSYTSEIQGVIVVTAPEERCIARAMQRDSVSREAIVARLSGHLSTQEKLSRADYVIENNGTLEELAIKVHSLYATLCDAKKQ
jgi:dephospho-CoA kinase